MNLLRTQSSCENSSVVVFTNMKSYQVFRWSTIWFIEDLHRNVSIKRRLSKGTASLVDGLIIWNFHESTTDIIIKSDKYSRI